MCGKYKPSEMTIDHIIPMWRFTGSHKDTNNWQVLCKQCHLLKTREDSYGVGYVHKTTSGHDGITLSGEIEKPVWYSLRSLIEDTFVSSIDIYVPAENYLMYVVDKLAKNSKQVDAWKSLKLKSTKHAKILEEKADPNTSVSTKIKDIVNKQSPLSRHIHDDDTYLLINSEFEGDKYSKLNRKEYYPFLQHFLNDNTAPDRWIIFTDGMPEQLADHVVYMNESNTEKKRRVPAIAVLGAIFAPDLSVDGASTEIIYNPETLKFSFASRE